MHMLSIAFDATDFKSVIIIQLKIRLNNFFIK